MRMLAFMKRTTKEIVLDPLAVFFGVGFPIVLLLLLTAINSGIPKGQGPDTFDLEKLTPAISVFGLSFINLFAALLVSKDRGSSLLQRLFTTPLTAADYIIGYLLPMLPIALLQAAVCYFVALILGLEFSINFLLMLAGTLVIAVLFAAMGLLFGTLLNEKQVGGLCGALITNVSAWFSGAWFSLDSVGGAFKSVGRILPFYHAVEIQRALLRGDLSGAVDEGHLWILLGYIAVIFAAAVLVFTKKMKEK